MRRDVLQVGVIGPIPSLVGWSGGARAVSGPTDRRARLDAWMPTGRPRGETRRPTPRKPTLDSSAPAKERPAKRPRAATAPPSASPGRAGTWPSLALRREDAISQPGAVTAMNSTRGDEKSVSAGLNSPVRPAQWVHAEIIGAAGARRTLGYQIALSTALASSATLGTTCIGSTSGRVTATPGANELPPAVGALWCLYAGELVSCLLLRTTVGSRARSAPGRSVVRAGLAPRPP